MGRGISGHKRRMNGLNGGAVDDHSLPANVCASDSVMMCVDPNGKERGEEERSASRSAAAAEWKKVRGGVEVEAEGVSLVICT